MHDKTRPLALVVEDEALLTLAVEDLLTAEGFDILCAASCALQARDRSWP